MQKLTVLFCMVFSAHHQVTKSSKSANPTSTRQGERIFGVCSTVCTGFSKFGHSHSAIVLLASLSFLHAPDSARPATSCLVHARVAQTYLVHARVSRMPLLRSRLEWTPLCMPCRPLPLVHSSLVRMPSRPFLPSSNTLCPS